jgi:hypothetical protein
MREIAIRCWGRSMRYYTKERDDGLCEHCDLDTIWLRNELTRLRHRDRGLWLRQIAELGFTRKEGLKSFWQVDHIDPVAITGPTGLDGVQTLCTRCHKRKTTGDLVTIRRVQKNGKKKSTEPKPTRFQKKDIWLSAMTVKVETVRKAHKTDCINCEERPDEQRLKVQRGAGRGASSEVYCRPCGEDFLRRMEKESVRAIQMLLYGACHDGGAIRIADEQFENVKQTKKAQAEERKRKKAASA